MRKYRVHKQIFGSLRKCYEDGLTSCPARYKNVIKEAEVVAVYFLDINKNWKAYVTCYIADGQYQITIQNSNLDEHYNKWCNSYTNYQMGTSRNDANDRFKHIVETAKVNGMMLMKRMK